MGSLHKKFRDANDKRVLKQMFGTEPKHRCKVCHRFSLFNHNDPKLKEHNGCVMCYLIEQTRKERADEEERNNKSEDSGE
jgi:hypothetical protein